MVILQHFRPQTRHASCILTKSLATLVNSQLVCLRPVGILNHIMFDLNCLFQEFARPHWHQCYKYCRGKITEIISFIIINYLNFHNSKDRNNFNDRSGSFIVCLMIHLDIDRDVSTAYCRSSSGDIRVDSLSRTICTTVVVSD